MQKLHSAVRHLWDSVSEPAIEWSTAVHVAVLALLVTVLSGCELVGDLLKLGFWTGVIIVVIIVVLILAVMRFFRRRL